MAERILNVYSKSITSPWLFDDLKMHFQKLDLKGIRIITSQYPDQNADAWIAIRTTEAILSPNVEKTVVCIHDLYDHDNIYQPNGLRGIVHKVKGLVLCHPDQKKILLRNGVSITNKNILERPIGALSAFHPGSNKPEKFTIAWIGRNHWRKRISWFIKAIQQLELPKTEFKIILLGKGIEESGAFLQSLGFNCEIYPKENYPITTYPNLYRKMNCLVITSSTEAGPLTLFESLATGKPVISTKVGWAPIIDVGNTEAITLVDTPLEISKAIKALYLKNKRDFYNPDEISRLMNDYTLEDWIKEVVALAYSLITKTEMVSLE
ncbi:glycosyltransferase [Aquimarina sp. 2201CG14-23]|uniref:glycosyltransferase n=1 Tax=Aquimarina mycalae TaxID=3040073 RepID=UPI00247818C0|nr:glycosyltransferase [Aquimarina sp. 2201CG14-23]MDH7448106.1 glycosyltransferase [Aquimarina sp. 2201CG14-23]